MEKILIGKIVNAVGLKGEVKVYNYSDSIAAYENTETLYVDDTAHRVEGARRQKGTVVLKLEGIDDRNDAEKVRGSEIFMREEDLPPLPEGQFYIRDLIGMKVKEAEGEYLGTLTDVISNRAHDIFEIAREDGRKFLIPKVSQFVLNIDKDRREVTVKLIEGLVDL
ncbi:MAG: 16S rRNA processing protein RimM [Clostridiales bacterium]|nr:16S rRNA processing protein RimM [Clostridiales bacterium]